MPDGDLCCKGTLSLAEILQLFDRVHNGPPALTCAALGCWIGGRPFDKIHHSGLGQLDANTIKLIIVSLDYREPVLRIRNYL